MLSHLDLWWQQSSQWQRWAAGAALLVLAAGGAWLALPPSAASRPLTHAEIAGFDQWVGMTADPAVMQAYAQRRRNGRLTVADARAIIEIAKAQGPGPGLAGPGEPTNR